MLKIFTNVFIPSKVLKFKMFVISKFFHNSPGHKFFISIYHLGIKK